MKTKKTKNSVGKLIHTLTGLKSELQTSTMIRGEVYDSITLIEEEYNLIFVIGHIESEEGQGEEYPLYSVYAILTAKGLANKIYKIQTEEIKSFYYDYDDEGDYYCGFIVGKGIFYNYRKQWTSIGNIGRCTTTKDIEFLNKVRSKLQEIKVI